VIRKRRGIAANAPITAFAECDSASHPNLRLSMRVSWCLPARPACATFPPTLVNREDCMWPGWVILEEQITIGVSRANPHKKTQPRATC
jgi:hypothetical protein